MKTATIVTIKIIERTCTTPQNDHGNTNFQPTIQKLSKREHNNYRLRHILFDLCSIFYNKMLALGAKWLFVLSCDLEDLFLFGHWKTRCCRKIRYALLKIFAIKPCHRSPSTISLPYLPFPWHDTCSMTYVVVCWDAFFFKIPPRGVQHTPSARKHPQGEKFPDCRIQNRSYGESVHLVRHSTAMVAYERVHVRTSTTRPKMLLIVSTQKVISNSNVFVHQQEHCF